MAASTMRQLGLHAVRSHLLRPSPRAMSAFNRPALRSFSRSVSRPYATETAPSPEPTTTQAALGQLQNGFEDGAEEGVTYSEEDDWTRSYKGLGSTPFSPEAADILMAPIDPADVEVKPDGIIYLPEIKYRRILNRAFGPGGWGLAPRGETIVTAQSITREYGLIVHGR
jgi:hypothetical protein